MSKSKHVLSYQGAGNGVEVFNNGQLVVHTIAGATKKDAPSFHISAIKGSHSLTTETDLKLTVVSGAVTVSIEGVAKALAAGKSLKVAEGIEFIIKSEAPALLRGVSGDSRGYAANVGGQDPKP